MKALTLLRRIYLKHTFSSPSFPDRGHYSAIFNPSNAKLYTFDDIISIVATTLVDFTTVGFGRLVHRIKLSFDCAAPPKQHRQDR